MLSLLADFSEHFGPLRLFGYVTVRVIGALVTSFALMLIVMPPLIRWLKRKKFGEAGGKNEGAAIVDAMREGKKGTPTMGGLGLIGCIVISAVLWCDPTVWRPWVLVGGTLAFAFVGFLDDRTKIFAGARGTPESIKLGLQVGFALLCGAAVWLIQDTYAKQLLPGDHPAGWPADWYKKVLGDAIYTVRLATNQVAFPFVPVSWAIGLGIGIIAWVAFITTACANGVNFTDGMDGLAAGIMFIAAIAFMIIAYLVGRVDAADYLHVLYVPDGEEISVFCAAVAGACLGFLWFNGAPAQVFMGDTGSQALGAALALAAVQAKQEFLIPIVGLVVVVEAASVALQKIVFKATKHRPGGGIRVFRCAPIHHHFQYLGWPESRIVLRFWIVGAFVALIGLATLKLH